MANKTLLLALCLVTITALVSAHRPLLVDGPGTSEGPGLDSLGGRGCAGNEKIVSLGGRGCTGNEKIDSLGHRGSDGSEQQINLLGKMRIERKLQSLNSVEKTGSEDNKPITGLNGMKASGLTLGVIPITLPGSDGQFQFQLGPVGLGAGWNFGFVPPGSVVSFAQPVVVSPYSPPSAGPSPSFGGYVQPFQQQPGPFQPSGPSPRGPSPQGPPPSPRGPSPQGPQQYIPYPSVGGIVQGSIGGNAFYPPAGEIVPGIN